MDMKTLLTVAALTLAPAAQAKPINPLPTKAAAQAASNRSLVVKVNRAPVTQRWSSIVNYYTGGSYSVSLINQMWQRAPRNRTVLAAAVRYRVPYRLLLGVWGIESGYGRAWNHFGLIGPATGNLRHDAFYAARLFNKFYQRSYGKPAL